MSKIFGTPFAAVCPLYVAKYNARRLHSTLGDVPPDECKAAHYAGLETPSHPVLAPA